MSLTLIYKKCVIQFLIMRSCYIITYMKTEQSTQVGIPRALSYYNFFPFWYGFFNALGIKVVVSDKTTKNILSSGSSLVVAETCLPVKIYVGHVLNLLEKGVDKIFIPSIQSIAPKVYNCSKLRGLPDLIRNVVKKDFTIIDVTFDKSQKNQGLNEFLIETAKYFGIKDEQKIKAASKEGWKVSNNFQIMTQSGVEYEKALKFALSGKIIIAGSEKTYPITVALISHGYNIFDELISMNIFKKLKSQDVKVYCAQSLSQEQMSEGINSFNSTLYWANEFEMIGAAGHFLQDAKIDGIIALSSFGCGPDSLMIERIMRSAKDFKKPLLNLTVDEHSGEAGFLTRLEAFIDMLYRKKRSQLSAASK